MISSAHREDANAKLTAAELASFCASLARAQAATQAPPSNGVDAGHRAGASPASALSPDLVDELGSVVGAACQRYPTLSRLDLLETLARRLGGSSDLGLGLRSLAVGDLGLAVACVAGDRAALHDLEGLLQSAAVRSAHPAYADEGMRSELIQLLRLRLLMARDGKRPKLCEYAGRGPLVGWLRVVALRVALNTHRASGARSKRDTSDERLLSALTAPRAQAPETQCMTAEGRAALHAAFKAALAQLAPTDRTLLRLYVADRLSIDELARLLGAHRATAFRRVARASQALFDAMRRELAGTLWLSRSEVESLLCGLRSQLGSMLRLALES